MFQLHVARLIEKAPPSSNLAFLDFTNCFALTCARCETAFCAYCLHDCRREYNDAHAHVARCKYNIAPGKSIFADFATFEQAQNIRRLPALLDYLSAIEDVPTRAAVAAAIRSDCEDLGIIFVD